MKINRKIAIVATHVKMEDEDTLDVAFWLAQSPAARLAEVFRLRKNYFTWVNGTFPQKMEKVVSWRKLRENSI
jgi:hypothetical protein